MFAKIKYPIIQAPLAGNILTPSFVAQVCNNGMLGSIPGGYLTPELLSDFIGATKKLTENPFIVNIFIEDYRIKAQPWPKPANVVKIEKALGIESGSTFSEPANRQQDDYVDLLIANNIKYVSCTFGFFNLPAVQKLHTYGIKIIATTTSVAEAEYCSQNGADAIIIQGSEAGGHQGSFLSDQANHETTLELLKNVKKLDLPTLLIAAGGIGITNLGAYFRQGANLVQLGTRFMMTYESTLAQESKNYISQQKTTRLTKDITGRWARGITNQLMEQLAGGKIYNFPRQHYATNAIRQTACQKLIPEFQALWAGSNKDNFQLCRLADVLSKLKVEYENIFS